MAEQSPSFLPYQQRKSAVSTRLYMITVIILTVLLILSYYHPNGCTHKQFKPTDSLLKMQIKLESQIQNSTNLVKYLTKLGKTASAELVLETWKRQREEFASELQKLVSENVSEDDPRLLALIRRNLFPPSTHKVYKLSFAYGATKQAQAAMDYFNKRKYGFYLECGGLDGERSSNTVPLEKLGWEGLLMEPDPYYFLQSLGKNRKAWKLNAALCPSKRSKILRFRESALGLGKLSEKGDQRVPCIPLSTVMAAMNRTRIDFFSLDVEGLELKIIQSLSHQSPEICAVTLEYDHVPEKPDTIIAIMKSRGFKLYTKIDYINENIKNYSHDLFFVKQNPCS